MKTRIIATLTGLLLPLAGIAFAGGAGAQTPTTYTPTAAPSVTVNRTEVPAGGVVEVSGNASPNSTVTFSLPARVLGTALTNNTGAFRAGVTIPCDVSGVQTLSTTGPGINASTRLNIVGAVDACVVAGTDTARGVPAGDNLPRTGSSSTAPLTAAGIGLVLIGAATAVSARRRRRSESV